MHRSTTFKFAPFADEPSKNMITEAVSAGFYSSKVAIPSATLLGQVCSLEAHSPNRTAKMAFFVDSGFARFVDETVLVMGLSKCPDKRVTRAVETVEKVSFQK